MSQMLPSESLARLLAAIQEYERPTITGAALGLLVRKVSPEIDVRSVVSVSPGKTGALVKFVENFLPSALRKSGQTGQDGSGGDVVYEVIRESTPRPVDKRQTEIINFWNAFVRPSDTQDLAVTRQDGVVSLHAGTSIPADSRRIPKITAEEFEQISAIFLEELSGSIATRPLSEKLAGAPTYAAFVELLREAGHFQKWSAHRREQLRRLLGERLIAAELLPAEQDELMQMLDRAQDSIRREARLRVSDHEARSSNAVHVAISQMPSADIDVARALLKAVVDRMSMQEMRSLQVSFGLALDAVQALTETKQQNRS